MTKTYLYVKRSKLGLFYLGKTEHDPYSYLGSGTDWLRHIKDNQLSSKDIDTFILDVFYDKKTLSYFGRYYSNLLNIVESNNWANRTIEEGQGGTTTKGRKWMYKGKISIMVPKEYVDIYISDGYVLGMPVEHITKRADARRGVKIKTRTKEHSANISKSLLGRKLSPESISKRTETLKRNRLVKGPRKQSEDTKRRITEGLIQYNKNKKLENG
jgi:hypothetical protein